MKTCKIVSHSNMTYLGSIFNTDDNEDKDKDVVRRITMTVSRSGMLRYVLNSKWVPRVTLKN